MAMSENAKRVLEYVKAHDGEQFTASDIANALEMDVRSVNGSVTMAFCKKGLMERVEAEVETEDGKHKTVKFITLTDEGRSFTPDAE